MTLDLVAVASAIFTGVTSLAIGVIIFFLKRTIVQLDLKANGTDVEHMKRDVSLLQNEIKDIKQDFLTKEDFFREQAKTDKKLDRIMDILLEIKGGANGR